MDTECEKQPWSLCEAQIIFFLLLMAKRTQLNIEIDVSAFICVSPIVFLPRMNTFQVFSLKYFRSTGSQLYRMDMFRIELNNVLFFIKFLKNYWLVSRVIFFVHAVEKPIWQKCADEQYIKHLNRLSIHMSMTSFSPFEKVFFFLLSLLSA